MDTDQPAEYIHNLQETRQVQVDKALQNWQTSLDEFPETHRPVVATILENMRLYTEICNNQPFNEHCLEITRKILQGFLPLDMVSVQPMISNNSFIFFKEQEYVGPDAEEKYVLKDRFRHMLAKTRKLKEIKANYDFSKDKSWQDNYAMHVRNEISREIFTDLRNNSGTVVDPKKESKDYSLEDLYYHLNRLNHVIDRKTQRWSTVWVLAGPDLGKRLLHYIWTEKGRVTFDESKATGPTYMGIMMHKWKLYIDPEYPPGEILMGSFNPNNTLDGYVYAPYILLSPTPLQLDRKEFVPQAGVLSRYGKDLIKSGHYGRIRFKDSPYRKTEECTTSSETQNS